MKNTKNILIEKLHAFENHPYKVQDNEEMEHLAESIREHGVLSPIIVRPKENAEDEYDMDVAKSKAFIGAVADCLYSLISAPNFSEADKSFSLSDKEMILRKVHSLYNSIGEASATLGVKPMVYIE